jgi:hypothetical protein
MPVVLRILAGRSTRREGTDYVDAEHEAGHLELDIINAQQLELSTLVSIGSQLM